MTAVAAEWRAGSWTPGMWSSSGTERRTRCRIDRDRGRVLGQRLKAETARGRRHLERLVRPLGVVVGDPGIELGLGGLVRAEREVGQELPAKALVEPLDLAGGGRSADGSVAVRDAVLAADPVEQDLHGLGPEAPSED